MPGAVPVANESAGPWFRLVLSTVGLHGGFSYRQPYDYTHACAVCGAGATPVPPLVAELSRMGKKQLDRTAHDGHLVVAASLADALVRERLSGFEVRAVKRAHLAVPDPAFRWLHIAWEWPPMAPATKFAIEDLCPQCRRTGHFDPGGQLEPWHYRDRPTSAPDFGSTWERFGNWRAPLWEPGLRGVGGQGGVVVSGRARAVLQRMKVRHLEYMPLVFERG